MNQKHYHIDKIQNFGNYNIPSFKERLNIHFEEKKNIAEKALMFIKENKKYFFDVSTNISILAKALNKNVTVFTHSLDNIEILSEKNVVVVEAVGGYLNKKNRFFYEPNCTDYFEGEQFDAAFFGAGAITANGIYYDDEEDAFIKKAAAKKAKKVILLAEHQKYKNAGYFKGLDLDQIDIIIMDPVSVPYFVDIINSQKININPRVLIIV